MSAYPAGDVVVLKPYTLNRFHNIEQAEVVLDTGPFTVHGTIDKDTLHLNWPGGEQAIELVRFTHSLWVRCPTCGRMTRRLYALPREQFACRECSGVPQGYNLWSLDGHWRQPIRDPQAWLRWFERRSRMALGLETARQQRRRGRWRPTAATAAVKGGANCEEEKGGTGSRTGSR